MVLFQFQRLVLSCMLFFFKDSFAWLCLWSKIGLGSNTVLEKETAFPDFCILHLCSQLPKGPLSWPASDGKRESPATSPHRHHDEFIYIFLYLVTVHKATVQRFVK